jgi:medium-chain acyl-[acyl-carrier-protein] hydrolase
MFRSWLDSLPDTIDLCAVQLPGRTSRFNEPACSEVAPLVQTLAHDMRDWLDIPFALFGHSLGALLSFEFARQLRREQAPMPRHLFLSARGAPHLPPRNPPINNLPEDAFMEKLLEYNGIPDMVLQEQELLQLLLPTVRADFAISETYTWVPEPPLSCPFSVFGGDSDPTVNQDDLQAWQPHTSGHCTLRMFPGDHFFLRSAETALIEALRSDLEQSLQ